MRSRTDTDDAVQDVLVRSMKHLRHLECRDCGALLAYLPRAVINRVVDEIRRYRREHEVIPLTGVAGRQLVRRSNGSSGEKAANYRAALMRSGVRDRRTIVLRVHLGLTYQDIAVRLHMPSPDAARVASMRALTRLAGVMTD